MAFVPRAFPSRLPAESPHGAVQSVRGIILRQNEGELVVRPTDADVAAFGHGLAVEVSPQVSQCTRARGHEGPCNGTDCGTSRAAVNWMEVMETGLYDRHGNRVAFVTNIEQTAERLDVTTMGGPRDYLRGPMRVSIRAEGLTE